MTNSPTPPAIANNTKSFDRWLKITYLAGIIDGEGCFFASKSRHKRKNGDWGPWYISPAISVKMTDLDILEQLQKEFGGKINFLTSPSATRNKSWKPAWSWRLYTAQARNAMKQILPFMGERRTARIKQLLSGDYRTVAQTELDKKASGMVI